MSNLTSFSRRAYRLKPRGGRGDDTITRLIIRGDTTQIVVLPYASALGYVVIPTARRALSIDAEDFRVEELGALTSAWVRLRLALLFKKKKFLEFQDFSLFCYGRKPERKRFTTFNQHMFNTRAAIDGDLVAKHPELLHGWSEDHPGPGDGLHRGPNRAAIVVHIYYEDTWPDIVGVLKRLTIPFELIVTTVPERGALIETIQRGFPHAIVEAMENRGRDVRPFLVLLEQGRLDRYRYVCKIHGKKSSDRGRKSYMGAIWRRRLLFDLLAAPGLAESILDRFEREPSVGMIGPRAFRLPSATYPEELAWSVNRETVLALAAKMGVPADQFRLDFFGGTMFWVRPEALRPLRGLHLSSQFPEESGLLDGGLEHALERLFATSVVAAGYRLEDCDGGELAAHENAPANDPP